MLTKKPTSQFAKYFNFAKKTAKYIIAIEVGALIGSYAVWHRTNTSQEFRLYLHKNFPTALEGYYTIGERISGDDSLRRFDLKCWENTRQTGRFWSTRRRRPKFSPTPATIAYFFSLAKEDLYHTKRIEQRWCVAMESTTEASLPDRINKRDRERKNVIERRREERQQLAVECEQTSYFKDAFYATCKKVKDLLDSASAAPLAALPGIFDKANKEIETLKNYLSQSKMFLKVYDIRKAQENLQILESEAADLELKLLPKKKFGFKNRRAVKKPIDKANDLTDGLKDLKISESRVNGTTKQKNVSSSKYGDSACMISGKSDERLSLDAENVNKNDVMLSDLTRCTIKIYGTPSTLHMVNLKHCTILVGPVASSVFIHDCCHSTFAFACQQLRLHSSTDCTFYLHVTSRAIIEDSTKIRVAPYNWTYDDQLSHYNLAGLDAKTNNWDCVDDFNWLSYEKHSPNWSILKPELRIDTWD